MTESALASVTEASPVFAESDPAQFRALRDIPRVFAAAADDWVVSHDFAFTFAGAERVTAALAEAAGASTLIVLAGDIDVARQMIDSDDIRIIWPHLDGEKYRAAGAARALLLNRGRPVQGNLLASSYAFASWMPCEGRKLVYCHTPLRQIWSGRDDYLRHSTRQRRLFMRSGSTVLRSYDRRAARKSDMIVATSRVVARRIEDYYGRPAYAIVPPPVDDLFCAAPRADKQDHFLWVGRMVEPYKRLSLVLEAFADLPFKLHVVGDGPHRPFLEKMATDNVTFMGPLTGEALAAEYSAARAVIFPSTDDFGIVPLEAMATGTPVVAYADGGALDTVQEGFNGVFFRDLRPAALAGALNRCVRTTWNEAGMRAAIQKRYSQSRFVAAMRSLL